MANDLPISAKEHLLELAKQIPEACRSDFVRGSANRLKELSLQHENALVYTVLGWVAGELLDNFLTLSLPMTDFSICLTGDQLSSLTAAGGLLFGMHQDVQKNALRKEVAAVIGSELRSALGVK